MLDILSQTEEFLKKSQKTAIARVINTWRSSPRPTGSALLVNLQTDMLGSVSGGCVEKVVATKALKVLNSGKSEIADFGITNENAWQVGLSCGGALSVMIHPFFGKYEWDKIKRLQSRNQGFAMITSISEDATHFIVEEEELKITYREAFELYDKRKNGMITKDGSSYFVQSFPPKLTMLLIGSAHITTELIRLSDDFDFDTVVIDPRDTFAQKTTYTTKPKKIHVNWPQEIIPNLTLDKNTFALILSHDPKIDDEALKLLLNSEVRYIGALGSRKTHAKRVARLMANGFTTRQIERIHAPIGLSINAITPKEIALSIMAEVVKVKNRG